MMPYLSGNLPLGALIVFVASFSATYWVMPFLIRKLLNAGITGGDIHKKNCPLIPEMGGLGVVVGFIAGILLAVGMATFIGLEIGTTQVLIGLITVLIMALVGVFDDLFDMGQVVKAILPIFAAIPLMVLRVGSTSMTIPFIGAVDFGIWYVLLLIPLGVTVPSNLSNMLAGFNGLESGLGAVMTAAIAFIALTQLGVNPFAGDALIISVAMCGALLAFTRFNWFPARVFPGDVGTLIIGAAVASAVIIGNMEAAGAILVIPHTVDFFIKLRHGMPKTFGKLKRDKLLCPREGVMGLGQLIMKKTGGISETRLVAVLVLIEVFFALVSIRLFAVF